MARLSGEQDTALVEVYSPRADLEVDLLIVNRNGAGSEASLHSISVLAVNRSTIRNPDLLVALELAVRAKLVGRVAVDGVFHAFPIVELHRSSDDPYDDSGEVRVYGGDTLPDTPYVSYWRR